MYEECSLEKASFDVDDLNCPGIDIELGFASPPKKHKAHQKQQQQGRRKVSFQETKSVKMIPNNDDISREEKADAYQSNPELEAIKMGLRTLVVHANQQDVLSPKAQDLLRGLEMYTSPWKQEILSRKKKAKEVVFEAQEGGCDAEWIAMRYREVTTPASEMSFQLALMDEEQARASDVNGTGEEQQMAARPPLYQIMIR
ncbi:MAG: hypothetical protein SGILL_004620 [Bacillariaceae sp.]